VSLCFTCQKETANPKFCSRSCSAKFTNKTPKRIKIQKYCLKCNLEISNMHKVTLCKECNRTRDWDTVTYGEITEKAKYQKSSYVRNHARKVYASSDKPKSCIHCGYSTHYEICHVRAINSFQPSDKIADINNIDNLIALCRNHHWELDHGILVL
jgi:hypothetical protein